MTQIFGNHTEQDSSDASTTKVANAVIRYEGFEGIENGRRLTFRVKITGQTGFHVTFDVPDVDFRSAHGVTIQDAAPMAYEKLTELLADGHSLESMNLLLTPTDIANYISRHRSDKIVSHGFGKRAA